MFFFHCSRENWVAPPKKDLTNKHADLSICVLVCFYFLKRTERNKPAWAIFLDIFCALGLLFEATHLLEVHHSQNRGPTDKHACVERFAGYVPLLASKARNKQSEGKRVKWMALIGGTHVTPKFSRFIAIFL